MMLYGKVVLILLKADKIVAEQKRFWNKMESFTLISSTDMENIKNHKAYVLSAEDLMEDFICAKNLVDQNTHSHDLTSLINSSYDALCSSSIIIDIYSQGDEQIHDSRSSNVMSV